MLILTYLLVFATLAVLLWAGTAWFQGYIYSEPAEQLWWRAPAAAAALTLFYAFWGFLAYRAEEPGNYPGMFMIKYWTGTRELPVKAAVYADGKEVELKRAQRSYVEAGTNQRMKTRPFAVIVEEDGERVRFDAERDEKGYFRAGPNELLRYKDSRGRVMMEDQWGELPQSRWGLFLGNVLLYLVHFGTWFACCWLVLNYQWTHALGVAAVFWLIATMSLVEMLVQRVERAKKERPPATAVRPADIPYRMCMMSPSCTT